MTFFPKKIGTVKTRRDPDILYLKNRFLGDKYIKALAQGVSKLPYTT